MLKEKKQLFKDMMLECVVDSREQDLLHDLTPVLSVPTTTKMLALGDVLVQKQEGGEVLLMIERKSVRDLVQSLRDGRYHDQRQRWEEFCQGSPNSVVSLWLEGDLMMTEMDEILRASLLNALFRLQTKHRVVVHQVRTRDAFVRSLDMAIRKLEKEPYHLVRTPVAMERPPPLSGYKKSAHTHEQFWRNCLVLVPGVSPMTACKVVDNFPSFSCFFRQLEKDPEEVTKQLSDIKISEKRRLGGKLASQIVAHFLHEK